MSILDGKPMNSSDYVNLVEMYLHAINQGQIPVIQDAWVYLIERQIEEALEAAKEQYSNEIKGFEAEFLPADEDDLNQANFNITQGAKEAYFRKATALNQA